MDNTCNYSGFMTQVDLPKDEIRSITIRSLSEGNYGSAPWIQPRSPNPPKTGRKPGKAL